jgi:hypothetical protein
MGILIRTFIGAYINGRRSQGNTQIGFAMEFPNVVAFHGVVRFVLTTLFGENSIQGISHKARSHGRSRRCIAKAKINLKSLRALCK